jgi:hypothetical protein
MFCCDMMVGGQEGRGGIKSVQHSRNFPPMAKQGIRPRRLRLGDIGFSNAPSVSIVQYLYPILGLSYHRGIPAVATVAIGVAEFQLQQAPVIAKPNSELIFLLHHHHVDPSPNPNWFTLSATPSGLSLFSKAAGQAYQKLLFHSSELATEQPLPPGHTSGRGCALGPTTPQFLGHKRQRGY